MIRQYKAKQAPWNLFSRPSIHFSPAAFSRFPQPLKPTSTPWILFSVKKTVFEFNDNCVCESGGAIHVRTHTHSDMTCFCDCWPLSNEVIDELFCVCCVLCVWLMTSETEWGGRALSDRDKGDRGSLKKYTHIDTHLSLEASVAPPFPQEIVCNQDLVAVVMVYKEAGWPRSEVRVLWLTDLKLQETTLRDHHRLTIMSMPPRASSRCL